MFHTSLISSFLVLIFSIGISAQKVDEKQPIASAEAIPLSYGLVVDNSGSYRLLMDRVIELTQAIVNSHGSGDEAFVVTFVDTPKIVLRQEFTSQKSDLNDAIESMYTQGGQTSILDAVKFSGDYMTAHAKGDGRQRVMILITDGEEGHSGTTIEEVIKTLKEGDIRVFVIGLADEKVYPKLLDRLTKETGGVKYLPKKTRDEILNAAKSLSVAIRSK